MAVIRCPLCKAENTENICRRCKADLTLRQSLESQRASILQSARQSLLEGDINICLEYADRASELRLGDDVQKLRMVASLMEGDFASVLRHSAQGARE